MVFTSDGRRHHCRNQKTLEFQRLCALSVKACILFLFFVGQEKKKNHTFIAFKARSIPL